MSRPPVDAFGLTDTGKVREANEDQFLVADLDKSLLLRQTSLPPADHTRMFGGPQGHLYLVADGIGGAAGGRMASRVATEALTRYVLTTLPWFFRLRADEEHDLGDDLRAALEACQAEVRTAAESEPGYGRMGTTLTLAYVFWPRLYVVHAGDSRAYLFRDGVLHQVTTDHTYAQKMIESGHLTPEQAEGSRWSHVLYNCVGGGRDQLNPDVYKATLRPGDALLLCTDGVTKVLSDPQVTAALGEPTAEAASRRLVAEANDAGGPDNVTAVVARFAAARTPSDSTEVHLTPTPGEPA